MYIHNDDKQNYRFSKLKLLVEMYVNTQLNKTTNQNPMKSPKLLSQRLRKLYNKTLGTRV